MSQDAGGSGQDDARRAAKRRAGSKGGRTSADALTARERSERGRPGGLRRRASMTESEWREFCREASRKRWARQAR